jgi:hypothetical protein
MFGAGSLAGGALVLAAYLGWFKADRTAAPLPREVVSAVDTPGSAVRPGTGAPAASSAPAAASASSCPAQPVAEAVAHGDGQFVLEAALASRAGAEPGAFLTVAREAVEQGRVRDAEVALIAACHVAEQASGAHSAPVADVKTQMGQHYVVMAAREGTDTTRESFLQRASDLFSDSAKAYAVALGKNASKTRRAEQQLAAVRQPATLQAARDGSTATMGAAPQSAEDARPRTRGTAAGHVLVQTDPELSQMERDLQRLHAQASSVSQDPTGMRQRDARAAAAAATCPDRACLLRFYAQRRAQLLDEF